MLKIISWNIAGRRALWGDVLALDADIALLQEAPEPTASLPDGVVVDPSPWRTAGANRPWKAAVVKLSDRVEVEWVEGKPACGAGWREWAVSRPGTLAIAKVLPSDGGPLLVASMYGAWEGTHPLAGSERWYADGSAHRIISDLQMFINRRRSLGMVAAGDLNILYGYGEYGDQYNAKLFGTVFDRMEALGVPFVGPQHPDGRQADPWPGELPSESKNVPTYHHSRQTPSTATRQLDFVFASESLRESVQVRALNHPGEWGPSDHCQIEITIRR